MADDTLTAPAVSVYAICSRDNKCLLKLTDNSWVHADSRLIYCLPNAGPQFSSLTYVVKQA